MGGASLVKKIKSKARRGWFDEDLRRNDLGKHQDPLQRLNSVVDWEIFRSNLENEFDKPAKGPGGRPAFDLVFMFKVLIVQRTYHLSDENTEFWIKDRLSVQNFLGIALADKAPDEKTIWHFRNELTNTGLIEKLFEKFTAHLKNKGLIMNEGSIIDASFVEVPKQRNNRDENKDLKNNKVPDEWQKPENKHMLAQKDTDARWTKKNNETYYGYKDHVKIDAKSKLITKYTVTSASVHDSDEFPGLLDKNDTKKPMYADSAYASEDTDNLLATKKIENQIHERAYRNKPLTQAQQKSNKKKSKVRVRIEHVFGFIENSLGGAYIKPIGFKRSAGIIGLMNLTYNLFRFEQLQRFPVKA